jgi:VanZ family protein
VIRHIVAWGPATLWLAVLFFLSDQTSDAVPSWWSVNDTVAHLGLYGILGATLAWGRHLSGRRPGWLVLAIGGLLWALSDEWHQSFVPGRTPSLSDLAADAVGLLIGAALAAALLRRTLPAPRATGPQPLDASS